jgi:hypothetical protein
VIEKIYAAPSDATRTMGPVSLGYGGGKIHARCPFDLANPRFLLGILATVGLP